MSTIRAKQLIRDNLTVPTLPVIIQRISQLIEDPESGTGEIGEVISEDAPLAAKVLRIANSAFYGLSERCLSAEHASSVLGVRVLNNVVMQAATIQQFEHLKEFPGFDIDQIWSHSNLVAQACSHLARRCTGAIGLTPQEFHICGLLHDLGKVVMLDSLGRDYVEAVQEAERLGVPAHVHEEKVLGFNHTDVGAVVAARWTLPEAACSAIQFHHGPREKVCEDPVVALVANANLLCHRLTAGQREDAIATLDEGTTRFLGLEQEKVAEVVELLEQAASETVI